MGRRCERTLLGWGVTSIARAVAYVPTYGGSERAVRYRRIFNRSGTRPDSNHLAVARAVRHPVCVPIRRNRLLAALIIAPPAAVLVLSFQSGGFYPSTTGIACVVALVALAGAVLLTSVRFAELGLSARVAVGAMAGFTGWTLASAAWSHSLGAALTAFDTSLLYLAVLAVFALLGRSAGRVRVLLVMLAAVTVIVAIAGLAAWLLPDYFHVSQSFDRRRLGYPTGYWNTTGLLAGLGIVFNLHLACSPDERRRVRDLAATALVPLAATVAFTASRGALVATVVGVVVYLLARRSRATLGGLSICLVAGTAAGIVASRTPAGGPISSGHSAALALGACAGVVALMRAPIDRGCSALPFPLWSRRSRRRLMAAMIAVVVVAGVVVVPSAVSRFLSAPTGAQYGLGRFADLSSDGRTQLWGVAFEHGFVPSPLLGSGANVFPTLWSRYRNVLANALVPNSLYLGVLSELGLVGLALLIATFVPMVCVLVRHARAHRPEGALWAAFLAAAAAWLVFAAYDLEWEMPACTVWLFAVGGLALSPRVDSPPQEHRSGGRAALAGRTTLGVIVVALAVIPGAVAYAETAASRAVAELQHGDCGAAQAQASRARSAVPQLVEPDLVSAACAARVRDDRAARRYAADAVGHDPGDWLPYYASALVDATAGRPPSLAVQEALSRNPLDTYANGAAGAFRHSSARSLRATALRLPLPFALRYCGGPDSSHPAAPCGDPRLPTLGGRPQTQSAAHGQRQSSERHQCRVTLAKSGAAGRVAATLVCGP